MWIKKFFAVVIIISCAFAAKAQDNQLSPELEQMLQHAREYVVVGNLKDAVTTYKQLHTLLPTNTEVSTELGDAYYRQGSYADAVKTLNALTARKDVTAQVYQLLGASKAALKQNKEARSTIEQGLSRFPDAGELSFQQGKIWMEENNEQDAVRAWCNGIAHDPDYAPNYREAATSFFNSDYVLWGLLYGEEYLAMGHDTTGDEAFKKSLFGAWKTFFDKITDEPKGITYTPPEKAIISIYKQLTPVVSDGVTTENLTMVHTRFLMKWFERPAQSDHMITEAEGNNYPIALFRYQDQMIRAGWFDIYQEWLFGQAESLTEYNAWNKFHEGMMPAFIHWHLDHQLSPVIITQPVQTSDENLKTLFSKKKKR